MKHTKDLFSLEGKVAIVTGGRGLYGASISTGLCEMGASVVVASRNGEKCEEFARASSARMCLPALWGKTKSRFFQRRGNAHLLGVQKIIRFEKENALFKTNASFSACGRKHRKKIQKKREKAKR